MKKKRKPAPNVTLTPVAQSIADLIQSIANGSQRKFASLAGCSQPLISRIVNGQQQPGRELVSRIAKIDGVDGDALLAKLEEDSHASRADDFEVPVASCLLPSAPVDRLITGTLAVPASQYRSTLYAVPARACDPAFSDPSECLLPDDLIVMESSTQLLSQNVQLLHGQLCAVAINDDAGPAITLRRVRIGLSEDTKRRAIYVLGDQERGGRFAIQGRQQRLILLDGTEELESPDEREVALSDIVGLALSVTRKL